jgi:hypothetical protein
MLVKRFKKAEIWLPFFINTYLKIVFVAQYVDKGLI